jgi:hypothetical protein
LTGWSGPVFERRYSMIPVSNEVAAQVDVLKYVIGHGVKEGLVERVVDWPESTRPRPGCSASR